MSTAGRADGLDGALLLDECQIPLQECERLDENLALALHHLVLPPGWSLLGNKVTNSSGEAGGQWAVCDMSFPHTIKCWRVRQNVSALMQKHTDTLQLYST